MEEEHIASAQALLHMAQSGRCRGLPEAGEKMSEPPPPEDAWMAAEQERARTEQLFSLLEEPLVVKRSELITAAWLAEEDRAELSAAPGKFWQYMGYEIQRRKFLRWDEAVMLCEMGVVQLTSDGQPCSLQEVRARVLAGSADRERQYRLYAYLTRLGYRPVRHGDARSQSQTTDYERKIRLDQYASGRKSKRHRVASSSTASPESKLPRGSTSGCDVTAGGSEPIKDRESGGPSDAESTARDVTTRDQQKSPEVDEHGGDSHLPATEMSTESQRDRVSSTSGQYDPAPALKRLDFSAERRMFPRISPGDGAVSLRPPPAELLPPGVEPRNQYCLDVAAARRGRRPERAEKDRPRDRYPSCLPVLRTPVRNWAEFKQQAAVEAAASRPESPPADPRSAPLVPPGWSGSPADLLARLRLAPDPAPAPDPAASPLVYDVYPSDAPFRKSAPPLPEFRVFIVRPDDPLSQVTAEGPGVCGDGVPVCAAVMADVGPPALYTVLAGRLAIDTSVLHQTL